MFCLIFDYEFDFCHLCKTKRFELYATKPPDATYFRVTCPRKGKLRSGEWWCSRLSRWIVYTCWFNQTVTTVPYQLKHLSRSLAPKITRWKRKRLARRYLPATRISSRMALSFVSAASTPARRKHLYSHAPSWWKSVLSLRNPEDIWPFHTEKHGKIKEIPARGHHCFLGNQSEYRTMTSYFETEAQWRHIFWV